MRSTVSEYMYGPCAQRVPTSQTKMRRPRKIVSPSVRVSEAFPRVWTLLSASVHFQVPGTCRQCHTVRDEGTLLRVSPVFTFTTTIAVEEGNGADKN